LEPIFGAYFWSLFLEPIFGAYIYLEPPALARVVPFAVRHQIKAQSGAFPLLIWYVSSHRGGVDKHIRGDFVLLTCLLLDAQLAL
jgi:hypothetical protein